MIIVGHGARFHMPAVIALAEQLGAPVITTFKAKGQIGDDHPLAAGVLGRSGTPVASWVMNEADLLLVLGASFSNHTGIYTGHPIIQVDFDQMQLGKFHAVEVPVWGEVGVVVDRLRGELPDRLETDDQAAQLAERWAIWRAEKASRAADDRGAGVNSASVFAAMERQIPDDAVIAVDVGNHAYSFGRYFECKRHTVLMSGYLGSIGFGYPAAMGAWAAAPGPADRRRHRRRRLRPVHGRAHHRGQARHEHHPRAAQQRPARQDQQGAGAPASGRSGRPRCTTRTSPRTPATAARSASA